MTRKIISLCLIAAMLLTMLPASVFASVDVDSYLEFSGLPTNWTNQSSDFTITAKDGVTAMSVNGVAVEGVGGDESGDEIDNTLPYVKYKALSYDKETGVLDIGVFLGNIEAGAGFFTFKYDKANWAMYDNDCGEELVEIDEDYHYYEGCFVKPYAYSDRAAYKMSDEQARASRHTVSLISGKRAINVDFAKGTAYITWNLGGSKIDATTMEKPVFRFSLINKGDAEINASTITEPAFSELPGDPSVTSTSASTQMNIGGILYATANKNFNYLFDGNGLSTGAGESQEEVYTGLVSGDKVYVKYRELAYDEETGVLDIGVFLGNIEAGAGFFTFKYDKANWAMYDNDCGEELVEIDEDYHYYEGCFVKPYAYSDRAAYNMVDDQARASRHTVSLISGKRAINVDFAKGTAYITWNLGGSKIDATEYEKPVFRFSLINKGDAEINASTITEPAFSELPGDPSVTSTSASTQMNIGGVLYASANNNLDYIFAPANAAEEDVVTPPAAPAGKTFTYSGNTATVNSLKVDITVNGTVYSKTYDVLYDDVKPIISVEPEEVTDPVQETTFTVKATDEKSGVKEITVNGVKLEGSEYKVTESGTYIFKAIDNAGNEAEISRTVTIDTDGPALDITGIATEWTNEDVVLSVSAEAGATVTVNGETLVGTTYTVTKNGDYTFVATDKAGNKTTKVVSVTKIDKDAPVIKISGVSDVVTNEDVVITIDVSEEATITVNGEALAGTTYTVTDNGTYTIVITDKAGNTVTEVVTVSNIDRVAPELNISANPESLTNGNVVLTVSVNEEATVTVNGEALAGTTYTVTDNGTYTFVATDNAGNKTTKSIEIKNIDKVIPVIDISGKPSDWTKEDVVLTVSVNEKATVSVNGVTVDGDSYTVTENGTYKFKATDKAGNYVEETVVISLIDKKVPVLKVSDVPTSAVKELIFTVEASDEDSGIEKITAAKDGETETVIEDKYTADGAGTYAFKAYDNAGNVTTVIRTVAAGIIDNVAPEVSVENAPEGWQKADVTLNISVSESATVKVYKDEVEIAVTTGTTYTATESGTYKFVAIDAAGNVSETFECEVLIDKVKPVVNINNAPEEWVAGGYEVSIAVEEDGSGIASVTVNGEEIDGLTFEVYENGEYIIVVTDEAGNETTVTATFTYIDVAAPEISNISEELTDWAKDYTLTFSVTDAEIGIHEVTVNGEALEGPDYNYTITENGEYTIVAVDMAGNESTETIVVDMIDDEAPVVETPDVPTEKCHDFTFEITATDSQSGVEKVTVNGNPATQNGEVWEYYIEANGTYSIKAYDNVGRVSEEVLVEVENIDNDKPVVTVRGYEDKWTNEDVVLTVEVNKDAIVTVSKDGGEEIQLTEDTYVVTENGTYTFTATDEVGNVGTNSVVVTKIDRVNPELSVTGTPEGYTNAPFSITVNASDVESAVSVTVSKDGGADVAVSGTTYPISENGTYVFTATDEAGNFVTETVVVDILDLEAPVFGGAEYDKDWAKEVVVKVTFTDNVSENLVITVDGNAYDADGVVITENGSYCFTATDEAGNTTSEYVTITNIDVDGPSIALNDAPIDWTNSFTLSITATDEKSGVKEITVNGEAISGTTYEVTENGTYTVVAWDNIGNATEETIVIDKLDNEAPDLNVSDAPSDWVIEHTFTVAATDDLSGVKEVAVNGVKIEDTIYVVTANGEYKFVVTDNAGNSTEKTVVVDKIDLDAPELSVTGNATDWTKEDVVLAIAATDDKSGIEKITVNGTAIEGTTYTVTENGTYIFVAYDNVGNTAEETVVVNKIDKVNPELSVTDAPSDWTKEFTFSVTANDTLSGIKEVTVNGAVIEGTTYTVTENGTYTFVAYDNVGNSIEKVVTVDKIDNQLPALDVTDAPADWVTEFTFSVVASDELSGIKEVTVNGTAIDGTTYTVTENGTYTFVAYDNVGNSIEKVVTVDKIDAAAPVFAGEITVTETAETYVTVALPKATDDSNVVSYKLYFNEALVEAYNGEETYTFADLTIGTAYAIKLVAIDAVGKETSVELNVNTASLGKIEVAVDLSELGISAEALHMNAVIGDKTMPLDKDGKVVFSDLAEGTYTVTFKAAGFFPVAKAEIVVENGKTATAKFERNDLVAGDTTADGKIDIFDLNAVASAFAESYDGEAGLIYDFNRDGKVNADDINILVKNYKKAIAE